MTRLIKTLLVTLVNVLSQTLCDRTVALLNTICRKPSDTNEHYVKYNMA